MHCVIPAKAGIRLTGAFCCAFHFTDDIDALLVLALDPVAAIDARGELSLPKHVW
jgi:hypothetical protein